MPVEIKELIIRAVVQPQPEPAPSRPTPNRAQAERDALVEATVREVLRILRSSEER